MRIHLPEASVEETAERLGRAVPDARDTEPPPPVRAAIDAITRHLGASPVDLTAIELDMARVPPFFRRVYEAARAVPSGTTQSYGAIAIRAGSPNASRAVGQALRKNPFPIVVPCHRVVGAGSRPGGFSAHGGLETKARILAMEGVTLVSRGALSRAAESRSGFDRSAAVDHLRARDGRLAGLIERIGPFQMELDGMRSSFEALAESIVYQQLTGKAAATIFGRVRAACAPFEPDSVLATADADLRGAGLSGAKLAALKDLAKKTLDGTVPPIEAIERMDDEAIVERLTTVRGVGRWTVEMLLIFRLGRPDVLPVGDYGVRKGFARTYRRKELPTPKELAKHGEKWRPFRSVASWYLWRALDVDAGRGPR